MSKSTKVDRHREAWRRQLLSQPDTAVEVLAADQRQEALAAVEIPEELHVPPGAPDWQSSAYRDAQDLYRALVVAGDPGLTLIALRDGSSMGKARHATALKVLRNASIVQEFKREDGPEAGRIALTATI